MGVVKLGVKRAKLEVKALIPSAAETWQVPAAESRVDTRVLPHANGPACGIRRLFVARTSLRGSPATALLR
jgi:hypothetical protein